ncbi:MAG: hypothetical protein AAGA67_01305 [Cyanobacteria bacterium P01_F01_bin.153]
MTAEGADTDKFPARLHVIIARNANRAIVFRRGPSKYVCTVLWNMDNDEFSVGQWLKGRIYERRSDISPHGKYLIYFALNGRWSSPTGGSWTAISRAPWLRAITLLGKGDGWHGGGLFLDNWSYWLNDGYGHKVMRQSSEVNRNEDFSPEQYFGGECLGVYYPRLIRDGWTLKDQEETKKDWHSITVFEKSIPSGWALRKLAHAQVNSPQGKGCYWDEHVLIDGRNKTEQAEPLWEWADFDGKSLVYAKEGCLYRRSLINPKKIGEPKCIFDFNPMTFEAIKAPYD